MEKFLLYLLMGATLCGNYCSNMLSGVVGQYILYYTVPRPPSPLENPLDNQTTEDPKLNGDSNKPNLGPDNGGGKQKVQNGQFIKYTRDVKGNPPNQGKFLLEDGSRFEGSVREDKAHGQGKVVFPNGAIYEGNIVNNKAQGKGKYKHGRMVFEGEWQNSKPKVGFYTFDNGKKITLMANKQYAYGQYGTIQWQNPKRNKQSQPPLPQQQQNSCFYIGQLHNLRPSGMGKQTYADGSSYQGQWYNGKYDGIGKFTWKDGKVYEGSYQRGVRDEFGRMDFSQIEWYEGKWKNGMPYGHGKVVSSGTVAYQGNFKNGQPSLEMQSQLSAKAEAREVPMPLFRQSDSSVIHEGLGFSRFT